MRCSIALVALVSCTATSSPTTYRSSTGDAFDAACANMERLGCPDGSLEYCATSARRSEVQLGLPFPAHAVASARTRDELLALRVVGCP
jgi:hypothetical protein